MKKDKKTKKNSVMKKLVPATGMLLVSAIMLTTSTYAWFTMSREVEVTNISMSATVPEDIQISLGQIGTTNSSASTGESAASLANGKGVLVATDNVVTAPTNNWDWSNIADVSEYYQFGKLIPASSTTGANIFFTPDANGVGKTIATGAHFYQAADNLTAKTQNDVGNTGSNTPLMATAHVVTSKSNGYVNDNWKTGGTNNSGYTTSVGWDNTYDDGYYVDIPVWFRTSSKDGAKLSVQAYVKPRTTTQTAGATNQEALYRALRVAIIDVGNPGNNGTYATSGTTKNLVPIADGWTLSTNGTDAGTLDDSPFAMSAVTDSILNWYGRTVADGSAAATALNATTGAANDAKAAVSSITSGTTTPVYDKAVIYNPIYNQTSNQDNHVVELAGPSYNNGEKASNYGVAHKAVIRIWLEGEDPDCWNETAGQDWSINLKFNNEVNNKTTSYSGADLLDVNKGEAPRPQPNNNP